MFDVQKFYLSDLNYSEVKEHYQVKMSSRFAALENLGDNMNISRAWKIIRNNIKTSVEARLGHYLLKQHKQWFDKQCS
jgi:hypothetical protein